MKVLLNMPDGLYRELNLHLLPPKSTREEAAFLFVAPKPKNKDVIFEVLGVDKLSPNDFASQYDDYLELNDDARARVIKKAHDLDACLLEMHSHPGPWPAAFSLADRHGLNETVPHMWWRLKKRPYLAIVVAASGFDALVWLDNPRVPTRLDGVFADGKVLQPTNHSLGGWK